MRPEMRAAIVSLPMLCVMERNTGAEGITERILDITGKMTQETTTTLGKAGKIAAPVAVAIDAHTIITESQRLSKFNELKKTRIPTQAEINEAAKSTEMLGALGGAEFVHPVREVGTGWSSRTAASAQLIQGVLSRDNAAVAAAGQRIDSTTLSIAQRQAMPDNSLDMLHQNTPGLASDTWTIGEFLYAVLSPTFERYLEWRENRLNNLSNLNSQEQQARGSGTATPAELEPQAGPPTTSDKWKAVSFVPSRGMGIGTDDLNVCEPFPGLNGVDWGEVFAQRFFENANTGKRCAMTRRDDGDPVHKRYTVTCEMQIQACTHVYCSSTGAPSGGAQQIYTTHETLELTKASPDRIIQRYELLSDSDTFSIDAVFEQCAE